MEYSHRGLLRGIANPEGRFRPTQVRILHTPPQENWLLSPDAIGVEGTAVAKASRRGGVQHPGQLL